MRDLPQRSFLDEAGAAPWVEVLSGLGEKGPACIRLWTGRQLWILDVVFGPEASSPFRSEWLQGADAVFITHDHIGGAAHAIRAHLPIHTTACTARALPPGADLRLLPECGQTVIDGIPVTTGRNGHAFGGVWLHFGLGEEGLFYSGDWFEESEWFAFDPPPGAGTALIDASYHLDPVQQVARRAELDAVPHRLAPAVQVLFPVPPSGRAGELALHLMRRGAVSLDDACRSILGEALASGTVSDAARTLAPLIAAPFDPGARFLLCDTPNADGGMAWSRPPAGRSASRRWMPAMPAPRCSGRLRIARSKPSFPPRLNRLQAKSFLRAGSSSMPGTILPAVRKARSCGPKASSSAVLSSIFMPAPRTVAAARYGLAVSALHVTPASWCSMSTILRCSGRGVGGFAGATAKNISISATVGGLRASMAKPRPGMALHARSGAGATISASRLS